VVDCSFVDGADDVALGEFGAFFNDGFERPFLLLVDGWCVDTSCDEAACLFFYLGEWSLEAVVDTTEDAWTEFD